MAVPSYTNTIFEGIIRAIADEQGWNMQYAASYWYDLTAAQQLETLTSYGFSPVYSKAGEIVSWSRAAQGVTETAGTIASGTAPQVMEVVEVAEAGGTKVALQNVAQTTTASGKVIQGGGAMTAMKVANGLLIATVVGGAVARDYKEHTDFWNDLSDAAFQKGEFAGINLGGTMPPVETDWNGVDAAIDVMRVIGRRVEDGAGLSNHYSYMSATDLAVLMQMINEQGAYAPEGLDTEDVNVGTIATVSSGVDSGIAHYAASRWNLDQGLNLQMSITAAQVSAAVARASANAPLDADTILAIPTGRMGESSISVYIFKAPATTTVLDGGTYKYTDYSLNAGWGRATQDSQHQITVDGAANYPIGGITIPIGTNPSTHSSSSLFTTYVEGGLPEQGIYPDPNAVPIAIGAGATIAEILTALQNQYPDWWGEGFDLGTYDPNTGIFGSDRWLPVSIPWTDPNDAPYNIPEGYDQPYAQTGRPWPDPDTTPTGYGTPYPYPWDVPYTAPTIPYYFPNNPTPVPTDTPSSPSTPPAVTGSSNALWAVYNPTFSEVSAVGSYLWSSSIIDIVQKFFANPMDGIISLHMIYTTPATGASQNIKLGYLDSGVSAKIVTNQYKIIDCGEILVPEYYQDVRDYSPYTKCDIFLPFIGIRSLAPEDVINCRLKVKYTVDVLTGAILAELFITKRGATQCLYTFAGNGSVQIPLTGGDRTRLLSGIVSGVTAAVGGAAVGGIAGMAAGAVHGVQGLHNTSSVERTGNFSANAGAMGIKKPYLIINRKDAYDAIGYNSIIGYPANIACRLADCSGYTKINSVHVENIPGATENEKERILTVLRSGIIIR